MQEKVLPVIRYENIGAIAKGIAVTDQGSYYSATAIASLGGRFPGSRMGVYKMAEREEWDHINLPGKGAKEGVKYFRLPEGDTQYLTGETFYVDKAARQDPNRKYQRPAKLDTIQIESLPDVYGPTGSGLATQADQVSVALTINAADWNRYVGLDSRYIKMAKVYGDSMKPTLSHGDQTLVDTACKQFIDDAIYCIMQGGFMRFKRIRLNLDGSITVKSDNEKDGFPAETYTAEQAAQFHVIGRVIPLKFGLFEI
ncbi:Peptidase S24-like [Methylophilus rhizosphaerae]|uniref:Peptidase S24-like n=1 Tax=Methylophilus rhizosphaerae TaxID=492660 RepID=A0A1G9CRS8_9PROT|nr:S24 family peptidase [Methylophilus rhizosphaerae]SDK54155.1 Peptidase S24-like [Methylophilus rhizosphaerae]